MKMMLKSWIKSLVRGIFSIVPFRLATRLVMLFPFFARFLPPGRTLKFDKYLGDLSVKVDTTFPVEREMLSGAYDRDSVEVIRHYVHVGDYCMDIGANVGALTLLLAKLVRPSGRVYAFEPGPPTYKRLITNVGLNPELQHVVIPANIGLSDSAGELYWSEDMNNRGNAWLLGDSGTRVDVQTLDSYAAGKNLQRLDYVKIDVEGMELEVLKGGTTVISTFKPIIYFETLWGYRDIRGFDIFAEIETLLKAMGYNLYRFMAGGHLQPVTLDALPRNTLAIHVSDKHAISVVPQGADS